MNRGVVLHPQLIKVDVRGEKGGMERKKERGRNDCAEEVTAEDEDDSQ